ncbi:MAG: hypothetical protein NTY41_09695 [Proteobacteria bacterium]|nr:hypothetical protein [Pseudomonadota bacterium]
MWLMIQGMNEMPDLTRLSHAENDELICRLWPLQFELVKLAARRLLKVMVGVMASGSIRQCSTAGRPLSRAR